MFSFSTENFNLLLKDFEIMILARSDLNGTTFFVNILNFKTKYALKL